MNTLSRQLSPRSDYPMGSNMIQVMPSDITRSSPMMMATTSKTHRIPALDFTKGTLVLIMVLYHWQHNRDLCHRKHCDRRKREGGCFSYFGPYQLRASTIGRAPDR